MDARTREVDKVVNSLELEGVGRHRDAVVGEDADDAVAAAQPGRGQAQLQALCHPQVPQPPRARLQESQGRGKPVQWLTNC